MGRSRTACAQLWLSLLASALVLLPSAYIGAEEPVDGTRRPRIGVALGGGGAKGCAHVGVLKVLEELRIPVDFIAGTSMGAIVGGLYATGLSAGEVEEILNSLDWAAMSEDQEPRRDRAYRRKEDDQRYVMNLEVGLNGFVLPGGLRTGQRFTFELRRHTMAVVQISNFVELPVPFAAVAVDLETGEVVILDHGNLATAIRASMSIPGVFTPVEIEGRLFVDGGIVNNLPIDVVREMGADVVIAVDVGDQLVGREELASILSVASQAMTIASSQAVAEQLSRANLVLRPDVAGHGALSFTDISGIIAEGEYEARLYADKLSELMLSEQEYASYVGRKQRPSVRSRDTARIEIRGLKRVDERIVRRLLRTQVGLPLDLDTLSEDLGRIYGLGDFELVDFDVEPEEDGWLVVVEVKEKRGGPFFLRSALNLELDGDQNTATSFLVNLTALRLNALGAEWQTDLNFGSEQFLLSELYQPLDFGGRWFVAGHVEQRRDLFTIFSADRPYAELEQLTSVVGLDLGLALGTSGEIRLGPFRERREQTQTAGPEIVGANKTVDIAGWRASVAIDRLDSVYFPRSGQLETLGVRLARPAMGADDRHEIAGFSHVAVTSIGRHSFLSWIEVGSSLSDNAPAYAQFFGGGLFSFSGYERGELWGSSFGVLRPTYLYRLGTLPALAGKGIYLGGWLEIGNYWPTWDEVSLDDLRFAGTLTLGAETVIGPAYLALGLAEGGRHRIYLSIGPSFSTGPR